MCKSDPERQFEIYRENLLLEVQKLTSYISLYKRLHERRTDRLREMNFAPAFFQFIVDALFAAIILWVDKLLGSRSERGFNNFLNFIEQHLEIFAISELQRRKSYPDGHWMLRREPITLGTINEDRKAISEIGALPNFKIRRDKYYAHFDKDYFFSTERLSEVAPIKWGDLDKISEVMKGVINGYSAAYDGNVYHVPPVNINDVDRVLDKLHAV